MDKLGLKVILVAFLFWYGLGYFNPLVDQDPLILQVTLLILFFVSLLLFFYGIGYRERHARAPVAMGVGDYAISKTSLMLFGALSAISTAILFAASGGEGMLYYHFVRVEIALGILAFVLFSVSKGIARTLMLVVFCAVVIFSLGVYSRRPFLTLVSAVLLIPFVRSRYTFSGKIPLIMIGVAVAVVAALYITGLRHADEGSSLFNVISLAQMGLDVVLRGEGFDTIHLTAYALRSYDRETFLYGESFLAGFVNLVPRSLWEDKPVAFGMTMAGEYFNERLDGLSTNFGPGLVAEAYCNGGYLGVFFVAAVLGWAVGRFDRNIENHRYDWNKVLFAIVWYPSLFFMVRGDFVNSFYEFYAKSLVILVATMGTGIRMALRGGAAQCGAPPSGAGGIMPVQSRAALPSMNRSTGRSGRPAGVPRL